MSMYDIARKITDDVMGEGSYENLNKGNPDPEVQAAIERGKKVEQKEQIKTVSVENMGDGDITIRVKMDDGSELTTTDYLREAIDSDEGGDIFYDRDEQRKGS